MKNNTPLFPLLIEGIYKAKLRRKIFPSRKRGGREADGVCNSPLERDGREADGVCHPSHG